ncbi:kinase-like protein [Exidia glandulosa HHB12029]|uniref:Kinase-like protein n=1 Tax=Exidia glandulosa HHB12029 TaxID=1314781 RepID=A0A165EWH1_EXIGL|nr:kinase-like protein [Exidia glandulosa HHB12029]
MICAARTVRSHTSPSGSNEPDEHILGTMSSTAPSSTAAKPVHASGTKGYSTFMRPAPVSAVVSNVIDLEHLSRICYMEVVSLHISPRHYSVFPPAVYTEVAFMDRNGNSTSFTTSFGYKNHLSNAISMRTKIDISTFDEATSVHIRVKDWRAAVAGEVALGQYDILHAEFTLEELVCSAAASSDYSLPIFLRSPEGTQSHSMLLRFQAATQASSQPQARVRHMQSAEPVGSSRWVAPDPRYRHSDGHSIESFMTERDLSDLITSVSRPSAYGGHSDVYTGHLKVARGYTRVAIKVMRTNTADRPKFHRRLRRELHVWMRLRHVNVLPLLGVYNGCGQDLCLVSPWCSNGDINSYLRSQFQNPALRELQYRLLLQVLRGLEYLHSHTPPIVHADLKGGNILISDEGEAQLCDFGMASMRDETMSATYPSSSVGGTCRWMAPELFDSDQPAHSPASDMYSFGCVMMEVLSGHAPWHEIPDTRVILNVTSGKRPARPVEVDDIAWALLQDCWTADPTARPLVRKAVLRMDQLWTREKRSVQTLDDARDRQVLEDDAWSDTVEPADDLDEDLDEETGVLASTQKHVPTKDDRVRTIHYGWVRTESPEPLGEAACVRATGAERAEFLANTMVTTLRYGSTWVSASNSPSHTWTPDDRTTLASECRQMQDKAKDESVQVDAALQTPSQASDTSLRSQSMDHYKTNSAVYGRPALLLAA